MVDMWNRLWKPFFYVSRINTSQYVKSHKPFINNQNAFESPFTICLLYVFLLRFTHIGFMCEYEEKVGNKTLRIRSKTFNTSLVKNNTFKLEDLQYGRSIQ